MFIFIISIILTVIVSACFFKKNFWENRYLVLLIGAGVALVATLTTNFIMRNNYGTKVETMWTKDLYTFYVPDTLITDTCARTPLVYYKWYSDYDANKFFKDSTISQTPVSFILFTEDKKGKEIKWGVFKSKIKQDYHGYDLVYVAPTDKDKPFIAKQKLVYNIPQSNWISKMSIPSIKTAKILHFPEREYAMIPDSLIRKPVF